MESEALFLWLFYSSRELRSNENNDITYESTCIFLSEDKRASDVYTTKRIRVDFDINNIQNTELYMIYALSSVKSDCGTYTYKDNFTPIAVFASEEDAKAEYDDIEARKDWNSYLKHKHKITESGIVSVELRR